MCVTLVCQPHTKLPSDGSWRLAAPGQQPQAITRGRKGPAQEHSLIQRAQRGEQRAPTMAFI